MRVLPGKPYPLGATWDGTGVNFALFSEHAERVELCLFDALADTHEALRITLTEHTDQVWHGYLSEIRPGQLYAYRVTGPFKPELGLRFNSNKLLLDPYAKAVVRPAQWSPALFSYPRTVGKGHLEFDTTDSAPFAPLAAVVDTAFNWGDDTPLLTPWHKTVIYETHVKSLTARHPEVPAELRGTYAGLATEPVIQHLQSLGVTAIELLPIHSKLDEWHLVDRGLTNYWGYNTLGYFAPEKSYACEGALIDHLSEFKSMVLGFHKAGIEVILDVVYNHTCEGGADGPTLCFRGIDNSAYYRLDEKKPQHYVDFTGCGNSLNMQHPRVLQLIMDSLRYWVLEMHIDGFRFDLASALARELHHVDRLSAFFDIIHQDPVLSRVKLIAEPWDLGEGGYQVGNFPVLWTEWNGRYRDVIRQFWSHSNCGISEFASRVAGSSDLYGRARRPYASINFVTCHDGFTLADLVSYNRKHNEANGEANRDGNNHNLSWNCGVEGPTDDEKILALREQQRRNFVATLLLSAGVPMISGGDEIGRVQRGNNNAYCQDNEMSWFNWELDDRNATFLKFFRDLLAFRRAQAVLHRRRFFTGTLDPLSGLKDIAWYDASGAEVGATAWNNPELHVFGVCFAGQAVHEQDEQGRLVFGDTVLVLFNADATDAAFTLPKLAIGGDWRLLMTTVQAEFLTDPIVSSAGSSYTLPARSVSLFVLKPLN